MRKFSLLLGVIILLITGTGIWFVNSNSRSSIQNFTSSTQASPRPQLEVNDKHITVIAQNLDTPWGMTFMPDGNILITERAGRVRLINNGQLEDMPVATLENVREIGEGGLLGITVHPDFVTNNFVYLYYTYSGSGDNTLNRVVRMTYLNHRLTNEQVIVDQIPGASNHNGGRIKFGPDKLLYIGTGDAQEPSQSQNTTSLAGKILRVTEDGGVPQNNPFNNRIFSYGHRNVQGLTWDSMGRMYATEHGRSGGQSGLDEINLIQAGKNYGWPIIQGDETQLNMETPIRHSGKDTWAPSGVDFWNGSLYFGGLRGQALYQAAIDNTQVLDFIELYKGEYGRIRDVAVGLDGKLYFSTSNKDGRGNPQAGDDKIIRLD